MLMFLTVVHASLLRFYRAALNAGRSSEEKGGAAELCWALVDWRHSKFGDMIWYESCPSVKRLHCDKTEERSVQMFLPYERSFNLVFWEEKLLVRATPSTWNFASTGPRWSEIAESEPIFARSGSAVTPNEKSSINTNRKSTTRFLVSLKWLPYVVSKPRKGAQNCKTADFRLKSHFDWRTSAKKFFCVITVSDRVVGHSLA